MCFRESGVGCGESGLTRVMCAAGLALSWCGCVWEPGMVLRKRTTLGAVLLEPLSQLQYRCHCLELRRASPWQRSWPGWVLPLSVKNIGSRAGEVAQRLRALAALPKVLSSILSRHMVAYNHL